MIRITTVVAAAILLILANVKCDDAPSVIIVGAGPAGIAAAAKLLENNITNVSILEAEGRIGGRIHSVKFGDTIIDLGAQWCHGQKDNIVYKLVEDYDILKPGEEPSTVYHSSHKYINESLKNELLDIFYNIYYETKPAEKISLGEYMIKRYNESIALRYADDQEKTMLAVEFLEYLMKSLLEVEGAFSLFDVSAKNDYKECEGNRVFNWNGRGYKTVLDVLMKKYPNPEKQLPIIEKIILNKEVTKIVWNDNIKNQQEASVKCLDGSIYNADHVIFTPSLGVLKANYKTLFDPLLPENKIKAIEELGFAAVVKVFLHFPIRWWSNDNLTDFNFIWSEKDKQLLVHEFPDGPNENGTSWLIDLVSVHTVAENPNALEAWFCGEFVPKIELCSVDTISDGIMFILHKFLNHRLNDIPKPDSAIRHNWYSNPHFRGTYSYQTVESRQSGVSAEVVLSQPLTSTNDKQTLLFAGEATHPFYYSTVHGAIETGHREAQRIINLYN